MSSVTAGARTVHAPRGTTLTCKGWQQEAALRMLMNNLDPDVAEQPWCVGARPGLSRRYGGGAPGISSVPPVRLR